MTQQTMPFFDSAEAATKHAIEVSGKTLKDVGLALWPEKSADAARTALANALNENRSERLTFDQHLLIANYCGYYQVLQYAAHKCSHSAPAPQSPEDQAARLQQALFAGAEHMRSVLAQIDALKPRLAQRKATHHA